MRNLELNDPPAGDDITALKARLAESEGMLQAIRSGEVDVIAVETSDGKRLFTREGAEQPYREMVEAMSEGAVTVMPDGVILYCNQRFAEMVKAGLHRIIGSNLLTHCARSDAAKILAACQESYTGIPRNPGDAARR